MLVGAADGDGPIGPLGCGPAVEAAVGLGVVDCEGGDRRWLGCFR
jgi:hypothetical protein